MTDKIAVTIICIPGITQEALKAVTNIIGDKLKDIGIEAIFTDKQVKVFNRDDIKELARLLCRTLEKS